MRNDRNKLEAVLTTEKLEKLRRSGVIFFDVDDTLLARRRNASQKDQVYAESEAARTIPLLLAAGIRVCIITGHGWQQLERRFAVPLADAVRKKFPEKETSILSRFYIYTNRGATKMVNKNGAFKIEDGYSGQYALDKADCARLGEIFNSLARELNEDFANREEFYRTNFPRFAFGELPPKIIERERVVLGLRPIPSESHRFNFEIPSPRSHLLENGRRMLESLGLEDKYELQNCGTSTLEFTRKNLSKKIAFLDMLGEIAEETGLSAKTIEKSSIYVGDEFAPDGNDFVIALEFSDCLCFSVVSTERENMPNNVLFLSDYVNCEGVRATAALALRILNFLT